MEALAHPDVFTVAHSIVVDAALSFLTRPSDRKRWASIIGVVHSRTVGSAGSASTSIPRYSVPTIDGGLLGRLTNDDLKDIGVASFGHRKKLLAAIAALVAARRRSLPHVASIPFDFAFSNCREIPSKVQSCTGK